jgi:tRNA 2-selenouridine synthase
MPVFPISAERAAATWSSFDAVIDARSPAEYADDHLPGAQSWPSLDNDERVSIGTEYKQWSPFDAKKRGAAMVARRIADHIDAHVLDKPKTWQPLVYCWRGGKRSGTLAWFLGEIGFKTYLIEGGYKAFRHVVRAQLDVLPLSLDFMVVAGQTGSGKTRLLHALAQQGCQVLDLEGLAKHRGSILGALPHEPQPSQKGFEMQLWHALSRFDPTRPVFVESESRKIGARHVPEVLLTRMRQHGRCVMLTTANDVRVQWLLEDYDFYRQHPQRFCDDLTSLKEMRGGGTVERWQALALAGQWSDVFLDLMVSHYDPLYAKSMTRNFDVAQAWPVRVDSVAAFDTVAATLRDQFDRP